MMTSSVDSSITKRRKNMKIEWSGIKPDLFFWINFEMYIFVH